MLDDTFKLYAEFEAFEKAGDDSATQRRIGGFVSTDRLDKQGEIVIQKGLDFTPFLEGGYFNDNHSQKTADVLGYPEAARFMRKGQQLPSGRVSDTTGWYVEGYLLKGYKPAEQIWELAQALQKSKRRLGYSVEGKVLERDVRRDGTPIVRRALVKNVAITRAPVNTDTELQVLVKSLTAGDGSVTVGAAEPGSGAPLVPEDLGTKKKKKKKDEEEISKCLTQGEALEIIAARFPKVTLGTAKRIIDLASDYKRRGII